VGWCGGTDLFDGAMDIFWKYVPEDQRAEALQKWYDIVTDADWDCENESAYYQELLPILDRIYGSE
jgi:hypothetical protein